MTLRSWAKKYARRRELQYFEFGQGHHHRVRNPETQKYVDFWQSGSYRRVNGTFYTVPKYKKRENHISSVEFEEAKAIQKEIKKLVEETDDE